MHWEKSRAAERLNVRPYQGVRVKDSVKELLRRKRGHHSGSGGSVTMPTTAVVVPNSTLSSFMSVGPSGYPELAMDVLDGAVGADEEALAPLGPGGTTPAGPTALQPIAHWTSTEFLPAEPIHTPFTADLFVQPICPTYTMVGPSPLLTYSHTPVFSSFGTRSAAPCSLQPLELPDPTVTYLPWGQSLTALSAPPVSCSPCAGVFGPAQLLPLSVMEPQPQLETQTSLPSLPLEKLLEDDEEQKDTTNVTAHMLYTQGL